jgi:LacI family transcriptional regulator
LLIGHERSEALYHFLERRGVPVLAAWVHDPDNPRPSIGFDNRKAMRLLAEEVIRAGHRQLAMISAERHGNDRASERVEGLREAMAAHGLDAGALPLIETRYSIEQGRQAFARLMRRVPRPTAVVCGNDVLAVGALQMAREMGLHVPGDVSITGFDDIEIATLVEPALTTVHVPHRAMGRQAAHMLIEALRSGAPLGPSVELQTDLRLRGTLGPPPA